VLRNKIDGLARFLTPMEVKEMADRGDDFVWLDVRSPEEYKQARIDDPRVKLIPLGMLRRRIDPGPDDLPAPVRQPGGKEADRQKNCRDQRLKEWIDHPEVLYYIHDRRFN
jgi:rhodanese-related sulfurtransferase